MTKVDEFMRLIESQILENRLKIGERLPPERSLSTTYGYSRQTVHNGLLRLSEMNLITIVPRQGAFVKDYSKDIDFKLLDVFLGMDKGLIEEEQRDGVVDFIHYNLRFVLEHLKTPVDTNDLRECVAELIKAQTVEEKETQFYSFFRKLTINTGNLMSIMLVNAFEEGFKNVCHYAFLEIQSTIVVIKLLEEMIKDIERGDSCTETFIKITEHVKSQWKEG